jgi:Alpha 1,4-glycosyltransferase conserved region
MPHVFRSFWHGPTITPVEKMCIQSFIDFGHAYHLYSYSDCLDVPKGAVLKDAEAVLPKAECFAYRQGFGAGSYSAGSNLFRYSLLTGGGWWVDTDVLCLTDTVPEFSTFFAFEDDTYVNGAVLYFSPGDPLPATCLVEAKAIGEDAIWGQIGPKLITRVADSMGRLPEALPPSTCYPVSYSDATQLFAAQHCEQLTREIGGSYFLHLWNEILRQAEIDKLRLPPEGSFLRQAAERHIVDGWNPA